MMEHDSKIKACKGIGGGWKQVENSKAHMTTVPLALFKWNGIQHKCCGYETNV